VARLLVTVGAEPRAWGRPWHVPSNPPRTQREAIGDLARVAGAGPVTVSVMPRAVLALAGLFNPVVRELPEVAYQMERPFIIDSTAAQDTFGLLPTPWEHVLTKTIAYYRGSQPAVR
jgi:hypothetical protein